MKVAIYVRVSTEEQHPEKQEAELTRFCQGREYTIYKVYTDRISGIKDSRPALNDLMQEAYARSFDAVLIWKLDRLGRSMQHLISIVEKFKVWKIDLICQTQDINTSTPNGKLLFHIFGAVAEFERELISERTKMGLKRAKNVGKRGKDKKPRRKSGYLLRWANKGVPQKPNHFM